MNADERRDRDAAWWYCAGRNAESRTYVLCYQFVARAQNAKVEEWSNIYSDLRSETRNQREASEA